VKYRGNMSRLEATDRAEVADELISTVSTRELEPPLKLAADRLAEE
jgi:hypothetical protein